MFLDYTSPGSRELDEFEVRILCLLTKPLNRSQIAHRLSTTEGSIGIYISKMYWKLGVHSKKDAIDKAFELGIINNEMIEKVYNAGVQPMRITDSKDVTVDDPQTGMKVTLTEREIEILGMLEEGLTSEKLCERLSVKSTTLPNVLTRLFQKLRVNNRSDATARARELGLLCKD